MRLEWGDVFTLLAFALGVGLLSLVAPAAIEALVNTVAFGILLWPVFVLAVVMFALLFVSAVLRAMQTYVAECLQRRLFVRTALGFADRLARTGIAVIRRGQPGRHRQPLLRGLLRAEVDRHAAGRGHRHHHDDDRRPGRARPSTIPTCSPSRLVLAGLVVFLLLGLGIGGVRTSIAESYAKFDVAAWLEEVARCPHTFRSGDGPALAIDRADHPRRPLYRPPASGTSRSSGGRRSSP